MAGVGGAVSASKPYPVYTLTLQALLAHEKLTSLPKTAWVYLILRGHDGVVAAAELRITDHGSLAYSALHEGKRVRAVIDALQELETHKEVSLKDYDVRLLRAPEMGLLAIWLSPKGEAHDLLMPVGRAPSALQANHLYSETDLTDRLRPLAERRAGEIDDI